jgi:ABC-type branched-subunit amino acid transport system ATPase component
MALLELREVTKTFGGLTVVSSLDVAVEEGEIVSLIGPNGAGKTTVFNLITGIYRPDDGDILLDGDTLVGLSPPAITNRGIARTFQTLRLFLNMTVKENVMAAAYGHTRAGIVRSILRTPGMRSEEREIHALAEEKLAFFGQRLMGYRWDQPAYSLSYANRRRLEIARAMATNPRILLLDEPAAGLSSGESAEMAEFLRGLDPGLAILLIEHDMDVVFDVADQISVLHFGEMLETGSVEQIRNSAKVQEIYFGTG